MCDQLYRYKDTDTASLTQGETCCKNHAGLKYLMFALKAV